MWLLDVGDDVALGVNLDGDWMVRANGKAVRLSEVGFVAALPLLERSVDTLRSGIESALDSAAGEPGGRRPRFPLGEVLSFALRSRSSYWVERAVDHLEHGAWEIDEDIRSALSAATEAGLDSQTLRHRVRRLLAAAR